MAATPVAALQSVSGVELRITMALAAVAKSNVLTVVVTVDTEIMNIPSPRALTVSARSLRVNCLYVCASGELKFSRFQLLKPTFLYP